MPDRVIPDRAGPWWVNSANGRRAMERVIERPNSGQLLWMRDYPLDNHGLSELVSVPTPVDQYREGWTWLSPVLQFEEAAQLKADLAWAMSVVHLVDISGSIVMADRQRKRISSICKRLGCNAESATDWSRISDMARAEENADG